MHLILFVPIHFHRLAFHIDDEICEPTTVIRARLVELMHVPIYFYGNTRSANMRGITKELKKLIFPEARDGAHQTQIATKHKAAKFKQKLPRSSLKEYFKAKTAAKGGGFLSKIAAKRRTF